ncbi:hypothetical protein V3C99_011942, partial [Haemonchus contortus]
MSGILLILLLMVQYAAGRSIGNGADASGYSSGIGAGIGSGVGPGGNSIGAGVQDGTSIGDGVSLGEGSSVGGNIGQGRMEIGDGVRGSGSAAANGASRSNILLGDGVQVEKKFTGNSVGHAGTIMRRSIGDGVRQHRVSQQEPFIKGAAHRGGISIGSGVVPQQPTRNGHFHKISIGDGVQPAGVAIGDGVTARRDHGSRNGHQIGTGA